MRHIACIASHSALDVFDGAKDEGFRTIAIAQRGRELPYREFPVVDELIILEKFSEITRDDVQNKLLSRESVIVPNRSFSVYVGYDAIERRLRVPVFGNKYLLRWEERVGETNYYKILDEAGLRRPRILKPNEIDGPVIVKLPEATRKVERGFFVAKDKDDFQRKVEQLKSQGIISDESLREAVIEEYIAGTHFNVNFFRSIAMDRLELLSIDRRLQTNIDDINRLPAKEQIDVPARMIEVGHIPVTIRESLLEKLFEAGHAVVKAVDRIVKPGLIGPFTLQLMITPDLDVVIYDVAFRIGGGTNAYMGIGSQYSKLYFREPISMGRRIAMEIRTCIEKKCLEEITT